MSLKIRIRSNGLLVPGTYQAEDYRIRPRSFGASLALHSMAVLSLALIPSTSTSERPIYKDEIQPEEHKIVWYDFRKKPDLPDVDAPKRIGTFPKPRAQQLSREAIIAIAPKPISTKQLIWVRVPKLQIHEDVPAPNLIARAPMSIPAPPPPPAPKQEPKPKLEGQPAAQPNLSPQQPKADVNHATPTPVQAVEIPKPVRNFIPPPPAKQPPRLPVPVQTADVPLPEPSITGLASAKNVLPEGLGTAALSKGVAPPPSAPPGPEATAGNAKVDIAIAGLNPSAKLNGPLPEGARPGEFAKAPTIGETATGEVKGALSVPDLSVREDHGKAEPPHVDPARRTILYAEKVRSVPVSTLSVPLRPASRTIPRLIDARFQGRYVYTMVVPIENLPDYSGDWIMWFAEREQKPGDTPLVRAPVPLRKLEPIETVSGGARSEFRIQIAAIVKKDGKIDGISLLRNAGGVAQTVIQDISSWEFKPATRDGIPVDVDVVLEIPFSFPPEIAKRAAP